MKKMVKVYFNGVLNCGSYIYGACIELPEDYTMRQLVNAIKEAGYKQFMLGSMKSLAFVS